MIESDAPSILRFAEEATIGASTPSEEVLLLERAVHHRIEVRNLGTVFATATQALRDRTGDCTEHAILLAACCRARAIPSRLVAGIVPHGGQMQFHLWTEVYLGEWVEVDATLGKGRRPACAIGLLRWVQPEEGIHDLNNQIERLIGRYRFRIRPQQ
jgi:transglutaminase-like putative cysteine protease